MGGERERETERDRETEGGPETEWWGNRKKERDSLCDNIYNESLMYTSQHSVSNTQLTVCVWYSRNDQCRDIPLVH